MSIRNKIGTAFNGDLRRQSKYASCRYNRIMCNPKYHVIYYCPKFEFSRTMASASVAKTISWLIMKAPAYSTTASTITGTESTGVTVPTYNAHAMGVVTSNQTD